MKDYEQLYYDALYENRKLKNKIIQLENEIEDLNYCRTKKTKQIYNKTKQTTDPASTTSTTSTEKKNN